MIENVIKKSGEKQKFDVEKIRNGIWKSVRAAGGADHVKSDEISDIVINRIEKKYSGVKELKSNQILDVVESTLVKRGHDKVAREFILHRYRGDMLRKPEESNKDNILMKEYLDRSTWLVKENANMQYSLQGLNLNISSRITENFWLSEIYPEYVSKAHIDKDLHIHDLGILGPYCFSGDTKVPLLDGSIKTMKELSIKYKDKKFEVFSIDKNNNIVSGMAYNPRKSRENVEVLEIKLFNNNKIVCTPDHLIMTRTGKYKKAKNLKYKDSLMPFYIKNNFRGTPYIGICNPRNNKYNYLHRIIMGDPKNKICHHKNGIKTDNRKKNLEILDDKIHKSLECSKIMNRKDMLEKNRNRFIKLNKSSRFSKMSSNRAKKRNKTDLQKACVSYEVSKSKYGINKDKYIRWVNKNGYLPLKQFSNKKNHCVKSIKYLNKKIDVYDLTVEKYHNFALDSGIFVHNCIGWSLEDLLIKGFTGVKGKISCSPPKHLSSALGQVVNFFYTLQGEAAGAQAFSDFDLYLAPFIKQDNLSRKQVKQLMQEFLYNCSVPTRVGFQNPFTNLTFSLSISKKMKNVPVIIGGKPGDFTYGECQNEMDMFNDVFCEVMMEGDSSGKPFSFPIPTFNLTKNFDWNNKNLKNLWLYSSRYGGAYFANYIHSDMDPEQVTSMCCRLRIDHSHLDFKGGGLFGAGALTGSMGVVTINMPRIGYLENTEKGFFKRLENLMVLAKDSLIAKTKKIEELTNKGLYPYSKFYLDGVKETTGRYWTNHFLTIGVNGMNEALINFGKKKIHEKEGKEYAEKILKFMRKKLIEYQKETGYMFNLEATPAESTGKRFAESDKKLYPDIIVANEKSYKENNAVPYYTNSSQINVSEKIDLFTALESQQDIQSLYTGGTVFHVFLGESNPDPEAAKKLIRKIAENYKLYYFSLTPTFSICKIHGYIAGEHEFCPKCLEEK